jgi:para-nitrobenzyl esterase
VWTPGADDARRPVLVWIHGGGFVTGSGNLPIYAGDTFARNGDLVVVSINYRVGALGYLYFGDAGNYWMTDQRAALQWVKDSIGAFGGDPGNITVAGQSGGAFSTLALSGEGLFHRMILQSPPLGLELPEPAESLRRTEVFLDAAKISDVTGLRALPWERLIEATFALFGATGSWGHWRTPFLPVIDGVTLNRHPREATPDVDVLLGWTKDEAKFAFGLDQEFGAATEDQARVRMGAAYDTCAQRNPGASPAELVTALVTDELFIEPAKAFAARQADRGDTPGRAPGRASGRAPWVYQFDFSSPAYDGRLGAAHCLDLPFVFNNADRWGHAPILAGVDPKALADLGAAMHEAWISFVRTGDPGWLPSTAQDRFIKHFDA